MVILAEISWQLIYGLSLLFSLKREREREREREKKRDLWHHAVRVRLSVTFTSEPDDPLSRNVVCMLRY